MLRLLLRSLFAVCVAYASCAFALDPAPSRKIELVGLSLQGTWRMDNGYDSGDFSVRIERVDGERIFGTLALASRNGCRADRVRFRGTLRGTEVHVRAKVRERSCSLFFTIGIEVTFDVARGLPAAGTMLVFGFPGRLTLDRSDRQPHDPSPDP